MKKIRYLWSVLAVMNSGLAFGSFWESIESQASEMSEEIDVVIKKTIDGKIFLKEITVLEEELITIKVDPKNFRFQELFLDAASRSGLNEPNVNKRAELLREGAGINGGADDFSNFLCLAYNHAASNKKYKQEIIELKNLLKQAKKKVSKSKREELEGDIVRGQNALKYYEATVDLKIKKLSNCVRALESSMCDQNRKTLKESHERSQALLKEATEKKEASITKAKNDLSVLQNKREENKKPEVIKREIEEKKEILSTLKALQEEPLKKLSDATGVSLNKLRKFFFSNKLKKLPTQFSRFC